MNIEKNILTEDDKNSISDNGFLVMRGLLNEFEKERIIQAFFGVLKKYSSDFDINSDNYDIENKYLHKYLINLRESKPDIFSSLYDELTLNSLLRSVFFSKNFLRLFSSILDTSEHSIFVNGFMLRMDAPYDTRNVIDWHQDTHYYEQVHPVNNSFVCWLPLTSNSVKNGTLQFIPKTHKEFIKASYSKENDAHTTQFLNLPTNEEKERIKDLNACFGDCGIFHLNTKHKSGENTSNKIRITLGCRFYDTSKTFNLGQEKYIYNKSKSIYLNSYD